MSIDTNPPGWKPPRTPEQAADAAEAAIRAALSGTPRKPSRWPQEPAARPDLTPGGDLAAWDRSNHDTGNRDRADLLGKIPQWQEYGYGS